MKPITVENVQRECGYRKPGSCYLDCDMGAGGSLMPGVWLLDWCVTDAPETQFTVEVPPRAMVSIDPLASLLTRTLIPAGAMTGAALLPDDLQHLTMLPRFGLADHVGESFYTPWSFFQELRKHGPSRRVPHNVAKEMAKHLPCPAFFFMPLPLLGTEAGVIEWLAGQGRDDADYAFRPTWYNEHWTFLTRLFDGGPLIPDAYHGDDHFMTAILRAHDALAPAERRDFAPQYVEMPFALSVFTRATYILKDGETDLPDELRGSGIVPAVLMEEK